MKFEKYWFFVLAAMTFAVCPVQLYGAEKFTVVVVEANGSVYTGKFGYSQDASAKVILPNGDHAYLICRGSDGHCAKIESALPPEKRKDSDTSCGTVGDVYSCSTQNVGEFAATRKGNEITIEAPNGKLKFKVVSSW